MAKKSVGEKSIAFRKAWKLTQKEFSYLLGCSPSMVSMIERGYTPVSFIAVGISTLYEDFCQ